MRDSRQHQARLANSRERDKNDAIDEEYFCCASHLQRQPGFSYSSRASQRQQANSIALEKMEDASLLSFARNQRRKDSR